MQGRSKDEIGMMQVSFSEMLQFDPGLELQGCRSNIEYTLQVNYLADGMQMSMELQTLGLVLL